MSYEDPEWYAVAVPPLTGYALPLWQMGRLAAELLLERLSNPATAPKRPTTVKLSGRLVVRQSARAVD